jgi:peptide chain release factor subunit 3
VDASICPWWGDYVKSGQNNTHDATLLGLFNKLTIEGRDPNKPLRIPVLDRYYDRGTVILGKVIRQTTTTFS